MRYTGPRNRLARREGIDLALKTAGSKAQAQLLKKMNILPGQHGIKGRRKVSEHGIQLREKQKLRYFYGVSAKQLKNYFIQSTKKRGNTALYLTYFLENRLDNIVFRLGFAPTRAAARQLVSHNHIKVNDKLVNVASYQVKIGDTVSLANAESGKIPYIEKMLDNKEYALPTWVERQGSVGKVTANPVTDDLEKMINLRLVVEFFSR
jgi:small subunit ribosomal protein S4